MKTDQQTDAASGSPQTLSVALGRLKRRLQKDYEQAYPELGEIIHLVLDEEEAKAWELSPFPHLLLPDLVEAHIANLNLRPAETKHEDLLQSHGFNEIYQPAFAACG